MTLAHFTLSSANFLCVGHLLAEVCSLANTPQSTTTSAKLELHCFGHASLAPGTTSKVACFFKFLAWDHQCSVGAERPCISKAAGIIFNSDLRLLTNSLQCKKVGSLSTILWLQAKQRS